MSTKIYDAYEYMGDTESLMQWLFKKRDEYVEWKKSTTSPMLKDVRS